METEGHFKDKLQVPQKLCKLDMLHQSYQE